MDFETFEKICRSSKIIHKMLSLRGYNMNEFQNQTKEELNILSKIIKKKLTMK